MTTKREPAVILIADDDADDRLLCRQALTESRVACDLRFVEDGQHLLDYLHRRNEFTDVAAAPRPGLILLDLNMPRMDGREALRLIKADPALRRIPVVVMTTSQAEEDIDRSYDDGANSVVIKPVTFKRLVELMQTLSRYWIDCVERPG